MTTIGVHHFLSNDKIVLHPSVFSLIVTCVDLTTGTFGAVFFIIIHTGLLVAKSKSCIPHAL